MPVFQYRGLNKTGKNIRGTVDADSLRAARSKLKRDGIFVVEIKNKRASESKKRGRQKTQNQKVGIHDLSLMTRQLATLLKANVPLVESLGAVSEQVDNPVLQNAMSDIKNMVNEGSPLYRAMNKYPKIFTKIYISMTEAGEMSGTLDVILVRLAEFAESQSELQSRIKSATIYPLVMVILTLGLLGYVSINIVPKITQIFEENDMELPFISQVVIAFSDFMVEYWIALLVGAALAVLLFQAWKSTPKGSQQWDRIILRIPVIGKLTRLMAASRFTRTLATLLNGGVPMLTAMDIVRNVVNNHVLATAVQNARENISEGESISGPLKKSGQFPPMVIHMINIGEKTGELEQMLSLVSDSYDFQVKNTVDSLTSLLNPILLVVMGGVVAVIVFAIMIPMFDLTNMAG